VIPNMTSPSGASLSLRQIGSVLAVGLAARLLVLWHVVHSLSAAWFFHRGTEMGFLAQSLLGGRGLSSPFGGFTGPTAFIAPGYPLFVSLIFMLFGSYTSASAIVLMTINAALNLLSIVLIMRLALRLSNARTAILAGGFWAVSLPLIWMPTIFWETSFSCCIMVASLEFALRLERASSNRGFVLAGACIAVAGLINPALLPMLLAMLSWVAYQSRRVRRNGLPLALLALAIVFSPWPVRNARVFHAFIPLRSTVGFEMWMGNRPQATGYLDESLFPTFNAAELREYVRVGEVAYVGQKSAAARQYIVSHPLAFLSLSLRRLVRFWTGSGTNGGSPIFILHACITSLLGMIGIGLAARRQPSMVLLSSLALLFFPLPYYMTHAEFRYRLIVDPLLTVFAAYAVTRWTERMAEARGKRSEAVAAIR
jgi:hypothetical protein